MAATEDDNDILIQKPDDNDILIQKPDDESISISASNDFAFEHDNYTPADFKVDARRPSVKSDRVKSNIANFAILEPREKYAIYKVKVIVPGDKEWVVHRRYSDFVLLNKKLRRLFPTIVLRLPPKRFVGDNFNLDFITKRQEGLEDFINNVFSLNILHESVPVQKFFRLDNPPNASDDFEECQNYCLALEQNCKELKELVKSQEREINRLTEEVEEFSTVQSKKNVDNNQMTNSLLLSKNQLEQQLASMSCTLGEKDKEIERIKEEYRQSEVYASAVRLNERQAREQQIKEKKEAFNIKRRETDHVFNNISTSISDLGKVQINVGGQTIDLKAIDNISEKERELKDASSSALEELLNLYTQHVSFYQNELEEVSVECAKREKALQSCQLEATHLKSHVAHLETMRSSEINSNGSLIQQYEHQVSSQTNYILNLEQKYFYSLILGVKLNMALYGDISELLGHQFEPGKLFLQMRDEQVNIESWPSWVSHKLRISISQ